MFKNRRVRVLLVINLLALVAVWALLLLIATEPDRLHVVNRLVGGEPAPLKPVQEVALDYQVQFPGPSAAEARVILKVRGHQGGELRLRAVRDRQRRFPHLNVDAASVTAGSPSQESLSVTQEGSDWVLADAPAEEITVEYTVKPGTLARHGHQGWLDADRNFGLVSGGVLFLAPTEASALREVRVKFEFPADKKDWIVASPWEFDGEWYQVVPAGNLLRESLNESVLGLGAFVKTEREIAGTNVEVYTYAGWSEGYRARLARRAFVIYEYQQQLFQGRAGPRYVVVFCPPSADGNRIFGGAWSTGQGFEMEPSTAQRWEYFAHRVHHVWNRDWPYGLSASGRENEWWWEATADFYEARSVLRVDQWDEGQRPLYALVSVLDPYANYLRGHLAQLDSQPLSQDYQASSAGKEFLHYTKAELVAAALDAEIRRTTEGQKTLDDLIASQYEKYGQHRGAFHVQRDVEELTGANLGEFFDHYVHGLELVPQPEPPEVPKLDLPALEIEGLAPEEGTEAPPKETPAEGEAAPGADGEEAAEAGDTVTR